MSYSKKSLAEVKRQLKQNDPNFFNNTKSRNSSIKKVVRKNDTTEKRKKVVKWNYKVNDIIKISNSGEIGLIVSDNTYFGRVIEKNYYYVLLGTVVKKIDGKNIRLL